MLMESETESRQQAARVFVQAALRCRNNMRPTDLARECNVAPSTISRLLNGNLAHAMSFDTLVRISRATKCPFTEELIDAYNLRGIFGDERAGANAVEVSASDPELLAIVLKSCGIQAGSEGYPSLAKRVSEKLIAIRSATGR